MTDEITGWPPGCVWWAMRDADDAFDRAQLRRQALWFALKTGVEPEQARSEMLGTHNVIRRRLGMVPLEPPL